MFFNKNGTKNGLGDGGLFATIRGIDSDYRIGLSSIGGKTERRRAAKKDVSFIYDEKNGGLYFNENGEAKGFGGGGIIAILKGKPDLETEHFEFDLNESDFY